MKKILIVEDEIIIGLDIATKLAKMGYAVTGTVTNPDEALECVEQDTPDLILMDINLKSDMDGIDLALKIRESYSIPVLYLTSYSDQHMIERSMPTEPYGYVIKPYTDGSLTAALKTCFSRIELEEKIVSQKNVLNNIMNSITDALVVVKRDGTITNVNSRFEEIVGVPFTSGKTIDEIFDGYLTVETVNSLYAENTKKLFSIYTNDEKKHLLISTSDMEGEGGSIILTITDLTEMYSMKSALFEAEKRFTKIFRKKMIPAMLVTAPDMLVFEINEAFNSLYKLEETTPDAPLESIIGEDAVELIRESMDDEGSFRVDLLKQIDKEGKEFFTNYRGKKVEFEGVDYYMIDVYDVTDQVRISKMEKELQQKLIHANKMTSLGTLVSGVAHEINNPNNFIMFNSSLLMEFWQDMFDHVKKCCKVTEIGGMSVDEFSDDVHNLISGIVNGSERIKNIVFDLKGFAKTERGGQFEKIAPADVLNTAVRILEHQMSKATENFVMNISEPLPYIYGNDQKIEQVLINVLMNSLEAVPSSISLVEVSCFARDGKVIFEIKDEGVGISNESLSRITEPFYTTKQSNGGTGLGLSIAYTIIQEHGGSLDVKSEVGKGTVVRIELPEHTENEE